MTRANSLLLTPLLLAGCLDSSGKDLSYSEINVTSSCPGEAAFAESMQITGRQLTAMVGYGGCNQVAVWACWDGNFLESFPVQVNLAIHHAPAGDCDAFIIHEMTFPLDPVLDAYVDGYRRVDPVIINLGGQSRTWQP